MTKDKTNAAMAIGPNNDWMAEEDMRTLMRAQEIRKDPKRHARAKAMAKKKLGELKAIAEVTK